MKILLILAFLSCCVIGGIVGAGCECNDGLEACFCQAAVDNVVKVRIQNVGGYYPWKKSGKSIFSITQMAKYQGKERFSYVVVPNGCEKNIKKGERYIMMGRAHPRDKNVLIVPKSNGYIKVKDNLTKKQEKFLRKGDCSK